MSHQLTRYCLFQILFQNGFLSLSVIAIFRKIVKTVPEHAILRIEMYHVMLYVTGTDVLRHVFYEGSAASGTDQGNVIYDIFKTGVNVTAQEIVYLFFPGMVGFF